MKHKQPCPGFKLRSPIRFPTRCAITLNVTSAQLARAVEYTNSISAGSNDPHSRCPGYGITQSDGEAPVMLEFMGMQGTSSLPSLLRPL